MTPAFWISSVTVSGHVSKPDSTVSFQPGLNVVCGPSNSGKSWVLQCIDYMFGADEKHLELDESDGYTHIGMRVQTSQGVIAVARPIGEDQNTLTVSSSDPRIPSGDYKRQSGSPNARLLSNIWLRLIGFEKPEETKVISNKDMKIKALTWRTFWHALYADEDTISNKSPILLPTQTTAETAFKSALATLITGTDFAAYAAKESPQIKKLSNNAVIDYLEPQPARLTKRITDIEKQLGTSDIEELKNQVNQLTIEVGRIKTVLQQSTLKGQKLASDLRTIREKIAEATILKNRYMELAGVYRARIDRYDFVAEGHRLTDEYHVPQTCPVCQQNLPPEAVKSVPQPDPRERQTLQARLNDLEHTMRRMDDDQAASKANEQELAKQSAQLAAFINADLLPQLRHLKEAIAHHNHLVALQTQHDQLIEQRDTITDELGYRKSLVFPKGTFNPLDHLPEEFWDDMSTLLLDTLGACAFPKLEDAKFNSHMFDAIVNHKRKSKEGQGYRSFVNTAVMLSLRDYLASDKSHYNPGLLLIDTPLLGLDDPQESPEEFKGSRETIPLALYEHLAQHQEEGQMIIVDNTKFMPDISRIEGKCNLIRFTKRQNEGRYGFLLNTTDEDLTDPEPENPNDN